MNKNIKILLATVLAASSSVFALNQGEYGRTALLFSDVNVMAENCFGRLKSAEKSDDAFGLTLGLTGYYMQAHGTRSAEQLGQGFGFNGSKLTGGHLVFAKAAAADVDVTFKADHRRAGANLSGCYNLDNLYEGLYIGGNVGMLYERNVVTSTVAGTLSTEVAAVLSGAANPNVTANHTQAQLTNLKVESGKVLSNTGVNNVDLHAGLRVVNTDNAQVCVRVCGVVPTGQKVKNESLFYPVAGVRNGRIGAGVCAMVKLLSDESYALNFYGDAQWQYNIKRTDAHIPTHKTVKAAHYRLVAKDGMANNSALVAPLANILSGMTADVSPQSHVDALGKIAFEKGCLGVDLGVHAHWEQEKTLKLNNFPADKYYFVKALAQPFAASANAGTVFANATDSDGAVVIGDFLTTYPSQFQTKVFGGVSCLFTEWDFPLMIGVTGSYTFASKRTVTPEYFGFSARAGVSF